MSVLFSPIPDDLMYLDYVNTCINNDGKDHKSVEANERLGKPCRRTSLGRSADLPHYFEV